jgi:hypothetical protein
MEGPYASAELIAIIQLMRKYDFKIVDRDIEGLGRAIATLVVVDPVDNLRINIKLYTSIYQAKSGYFKSLAEQFIGPAKELWIVVNNPNEPVGLLESDETAFLTSSGKPASIFTMKGLQIALKRGNRKKGVRAGEPANDP